MDRSPPCHPNNAEQGPVGIEMGGYIIYLISTTVLHSNITKVIETIVKNSGSINSGLCFSEDLSTQYFFQV